MNGHKRYMSNQFEDTIIKTWGNTGRAWLQELPRISAMLADTWNLIRLTPVINLSYNYVLTGYQNDTPVILKIGFDAQDILKELTALKAYDGNGSIKLIDHHPRYHALLLERASPGSSLVSFFPDHDDEAVLCAATIMQKLHATPIPTHSCLQTLTEWFIDLYNPPTMTNYYHIHKAQARLQKLLATQTRTVLLHGDLHHDNILLSQRGWLAIDPKGLIGDPAYEIYAFLRNPHPTTLKPSATVIRRLQLFADYLAIDIQRLHGWVYVRAVLEACWMIKDKQADPIQAFAEAEQIDTLPAEQLS